MTNIANELSEVSDEVFALVARELATGKPDEALWTKAFALQSGNESATKAHYIRLRAEQIQRAASGRIVAESKQAADDASHIAGPWARYFARYLDLALSVCLTLLLFLLLTPTIKAANVQMTGPVWVVSLLLICLAALLPWVIDAAIVSMFGNSLGKAIWGITVQHKDGRPLPFKEVLTRNFLVGLHGFWTGLTPLTFLPHIFSYNRLKKEGETKWDTKGQYEVLSSNPGAFRKIIGVALLFVALALIGLMDVANRLNVSNTTNATTANTKQTESTAQVPLPTVVTPPSLREEQFNTTPTYKPAVDTWKMVYEGSASNMHVKPDTLRKNGSVHSILFIGDFNGSSSGSAKGVLEVICTQNSIRIVEVAFYNLPMANGNPYDSFHFPGATFHTNYDPSYQGIVNFICR